MGGNKKKYNSNKRGQYSCDICERVFSYMSNLMRHQLVHDKNRVLYECHICLNAFTRNSYLTLHVNSVHRGNYSLQCHICDKKFKLRNSLVAHLKYIHEKTNKFICDYCKKDFNKKGNLQFHIMYSECNPNRFKRPMVKCPYCDSNYLSTSLRSHFNVCPIKFEIKRKGKQRKPRKIVICKPVKIESRKITPLKPKTSELFIRKTSEKNIFVLQDNRSNVRRSGRKRRVVDYRILGDLDVSDNDDTKLLQISSDAGLDSTREVFAQVEQADNVFQTGLNAKVQPIEEHNLSNLSLLGIEIKSETEGADNVSDTSEVIKTDMSYLEYASTEKESVEIDSFSVKDEVIQIDENEGLSSSYSKLIGLI